MNILNVNICKSAKKKKKKKKKNIGLCISLFTKQLKSSTFLLSFMSQ